MLESSCLGAAGSAAHGDSQFLGLVFNIIPSTTELVGVTAVSHSLRPDSTVVKSSHHEVVDTTEPFSYPLFMQT